MEMMTHPRADREAQRMHANREELVERIARAIRADGTVQPRSALSQLRHCGPALGYLDVDDARWCRDDGGKPGDELLEVVGLHMALARGWRREPFDEDEGVGRLDALEALELWPLWLVADGVRVALDPGQPVGAPVGTNRHLHNDKDHRLRPPGGLAHLVPAVRC